MTQTLHVVGAGAIGSLLAASAIRSGVSAILYPRQPVASVIVALSDGEEITVPTSLKKPSTLDDSDILIMPVKVHDLEAALREWEPLIRKTTPVVLLHNGMGGIEIAQHVLSSDTPLFAATTTHGALREKHGRVRHTGTGSTALGVAQDNVDEDVADALRMTLSQCFAPVQWQEDIHTALWLKLAVNSVINPMTAIEDIKNGELLLPVYAPRVHALCRELSRIMQAEGIAVTADGLVTRVLGVARQTAANYSSMHQDVLHQRTTEIDAINGYVVSQAKKSGIDVPTNAALVSAIHALQARYSG